MNQDAIRGILKKVCNDYGLPAPVKINKFSLGFTNTNLLLTFKNRKLVLRIYLDRSKKDLLQELKVLSFLTEKNFLTQQIYKTKKNKLFTKVGDSFCVIFSYIPGKHISAKDLTKQNAREIGQLIGRLHQLLKSANFKIKRGRQDALQEISYSEKVENQYFPTALKICSKRMRKILLKAEKQTKYFKEKAMQLDSKKMRSGIIHNDITFNNILFYRGKITGLLDFDACCFGRFCCDIGTALSEFPPHYQKTALNAYLEMFPLNPEELKAAWLSVKQTIVMSQHYFAQEYAKIPNKRKFYEKHILREEGKIRKIENYRAGKAD